MSLLETLIFVSTCDTNTNQFIHKCWNINSTSSHNSRSSHTNATISKDSRNSINSNISSSNNNDISNQSNADTNESETEATAIPADAPDGGKEVRFEDMQATMAWEEQDEQQEQNQNINEMLDKNKNENGELLATMA